MLNKAEFDRKAKEMTEKYARPQKNSPGIDVNMKQ
jgi:hypothetical protein